MIAQYNADAVLCSLRIATVGLNYFGQGTDICARIAVQVQVSDELVHRLMFIVSDLNMN
jgi:hypothetical protein